MRIVLETEERIRLVADGAEFAIEPDGAGLSPFHLLASSLATCTYSVLHGWAEQARLGVDGLEIRVDWRLGGDPVRVAAIEMEIAWPGLPAARREAARRVAAHCTIHHTLTEATSVETRVAGSGPG